MQEEREGWFVVNIKDAQWSAHPEFGLRCRVEREESFPEVASTCS